MLESVGVILLLLLVPAAIMDWTTVVILARAHRIQPSTPLRERRDVASILAITITLYCAVGTNTVLGFPLFPIAVAAIIPARFLWLYWRGEL